MSSASGKEWPKAVTPIGEPAREQRMEARAAELAESQALYWRIRLVGIETALLGALVVITGLMIGQPGGQVLRAGVLVSAGCLASGMSLIALTDAASHGWKRLLRKGKRP